jgi:hypothetical protein
MSEKQRQTRQDRINTTNGELVSFRYVRHPLALFTIVRLPSSARTNWSAALEARKPQNQGLGK